MPWLLRSQIDLHFEDGLEWHPGAHTGQLLGRRLKRPDLFIFPGTELTGPDGMLFVAGSMATLGDGNNSSAYRNIGLALRTTRQCAHTSSWRWRRRASVSGHWPADGDDESAYRDIGLAMGQRSSVRIRRPADGDDGPAYRDIGLAMRTTSQRTQTSAWR
jgi:hypothetical protein